MLVEGQDTRRIPVPELSALVGLVFQEPDAQLFNATVEDEIAFGLESLGLPRLEMGQRLEWALEVTGLGTLRRRSPSHLSGGRSSAWPSPASWLHAHPCWCWTSRLQP